VGYAQDGGSAPGFTVRRIDQLHLAMFSFPIPHTDWNVLSSI